MVSLVVVADLVAAVPPVGGNSMNWYRFIQHVVLPDWWLRRHFPTAVRQRIEAAITTSEQHHAAEFRFVVESTLHPVQLLRGETARQRALAVFSQLRIWDTAANNGVLIYLLLADRDVEIVADRGFNGRVEAAVWENICREMEAAFRAGRFESGALLGIARVDELLRRLYPADETNRNELPDQVALL